MFGPHPHLSPSLPISLSPSLSPSSSLPHPSLHPHSPTGNTLRTRAAGLEAGRDSFFKLSRTVVTVTNYRVIKRWFKKQAAGTFRGVREGYSSLVKNVLRMELKLQKSAFRTWEESKNKEKVQVVLQMLSSGFRPEQVPVGGLEIDLNAPADVLRIYMHRYFRQVLNETVGDGFLFLIPVEEGAEETGEALMLKRELEPTNYSRVVSPFVMDARTMEGTVGDDG